MKITYTVSWDEYLDTYEASLPTRSLMTFCLLTVIGASTFALGVAVLNRQRPEAGAGQILCWLGVGLIAFACYTFFIHYRDRHRRKIYELKSHYTLFNSQEQTFEFDRNQWTVETQGTKLTSEWNNLQQSCEKKSVFWLTSGNYAVILPKRAFTAECMDQFRELALSTGEFKFESKVGFLESLRADLPELWRRQPNLRNAVILESFLLCAVAVSLLFGHIAGGLMFLTIFFVAILVVTAVIFSAKTIRTYYSDADLLSRPCEIQASERGVRFTTASLDYYNSWAAFTKFKDRKRYILLFIDWSHYYLLSKATLTPEQEAGLRRLLEARLQAA